ncbi:hypothetical protein PILCRDRAFT_816164 [Piloderma croceum F 1598]|uniref:Uncharacterized protein n=1 Tax=Piloderma croceum (strain F 1598) TaxID=765440 RepID=A0A0C3BIT9_PILCF|nr:hypothetical protein PILCRDRAFT_816164 [Piloderma croceum F 1598]
MPKPASFLCLSEIPEGIAFDACIQVSRHRPFYPRLFEPYSSVDIVCVIRVLFFMSESNATQASSVQNDKNTEKTWEIAIMVVFGEYAPVSLFRS